MTITPAQLGFLRVIAYSVIGAILLVLENAANLHGIVPDGVAVLIAALAGAIDHNIESSSGKALFGNVRVVRAR